MFKSNREMIEFQKDIEKFHIKRWDELPEFDLYATQVIDILKKELFFLKEFDEEFITKSMINNYVKNKFIPKPNNKRYSRDAVSKLIVITLLKQVLEISDVYIGMQRHIESSKTQKIAYNTFCDELERALYLIFEYRSNENFPISLKIEDIKCDSYNLTLISLSLASKLFIKKLINVDSSKVND